MNGGRLNWAKVWQQYRQEIDRAEREYQAAASPLLKQIEETPGPGGDSAGAGEPRRQLEEARKKKLLDQKKALDRVKTYIKLSETSKMGDLVRR